MAGAGWMHELSRGGLRRVFRVCSVSAGVFVEEGLEAAISRKSRERPPIDPIFDGEKEARLIQLACSEPPEGHARWSLRLLESKSGGAWHRRCCQRYNNWQGFKKNTLKPHRRKYWVIAPKENAAFVAGPGGYSGGLYPPVRSKAPAGLFGRDKQAACERNSHTHRDETGADPAHRLRV